MLLGHHAILEDFERLLARGRLAHGYFFFGSVGVGKYFFAQEFARFLERGTWFAETTRPLSDALFVSPEEGGSIGIDAARAVKEFLAERPIVSAYRTVVIDRAGALTTEAQNALLKIAEEPPAQALLILIASAKESLLPTLASRLQSIYFGRVPTAAVAEWLVAQGVPKKAATAAAEQSDGKPGLAAAIARGEETPAEHNARMFLAAAPAARKDFLKELLEPEDFNFRAFLDALIAVLAREGKTHRQLWHAVVELRNMADATGLNPSMQLRNLWTLI